MLQRVERLFERKENLIKYVQFVIATSRKNVSNQIKIFIEFSGCNLSIKFDKPLIKGWTLDLTLTLRGSHAFGNEASVHAELHCVSFNHDGTSLPCYDLYLRL